ncbi:hypothetical protein [Sphaerisporangium sp. TRM90804]|uniref:hypothetical protein n=1 Tax=Sphaerisporangium sp. TRM90804 TaxID=3031113 RepID=UPI00244D45A3|nr:hypothetical protein [Sphaerisporangium sp. TRM90804]MDH2429541.1 hypothetical protein [Sphaerisporangium sp. TRM90804]
MIGYILVGTFHGSLQAQQNGTLPLHFSGATLTIVGGNVLALVLGIHWRKTPETRLTGSGDKALHDSREQALERAGPLCLLTDRSSQGGGRTSMADCIVARAIQRLQPLPLRIRQITTTHARSVTKLTPTVRRSEKQVLGRQIVPRRSCSNLV